MASPFPTLLENSTLTFNVLAPDGSVDALGNPVQTKQQQKYIAYLKGDGAAQRILDSQSVGQSKLAVTGYLIKPQHFSSQARGLYECAVVFSDRHGGEIRGTLKLQSRITATSFVESITGDRITGIITIQGR